MSLVKSGADGERCNKWTPDEAGSHGRERCPVWCASFFARYGSPEASNKSIRPEEARGDASDGGIRTRGWREGRLNTLGFPLGCCFTLVQYMIQELWLVKK